MYEKIKKWYEQGLWKADQVKQAVGKGELTQEQCQAILAD